MFISNNRPSFHLWWNENLVKHRKVSKYIIKLIADFDVKNNFYEIFTNFLAKIGRKIKNDQKFLKFHLIVYLYRINGKYS